MTTASPAAGISPELIDQIRAKLAKTTVEHYINGRWTEGARGEATGDLRALGDQGKG